MSIQQTCERRAKHRAQLKCLVRALVVGLFLSYCLWNLAWLPLGRTAPSMLTGLCGLPCPTTGGTRAFMCLMRGDVAASLRYNAMTVPILALLALTLGHLVHRAARRQRLVVPQGVFVAWMAVLAFAWVLKLVGNPAYW